MCDAQVMGVTNNKKLHNCGGFSVAWTDIKKKPFKSTIFGSGAERLIMTEGVNALFPRQCFVRDGLFAATSLSRSNRVVLLYDKAHSTSSRLAIPAPPSTSKSGWSSMSVVAAGNGLIAVLLGSPLSVPPILAVGKVPDSNGTNSSDATNCTEWMFYDKLFGSTEESCLDTSKFSWKLDTIEPEEPKRTHPFEVIYLSNKDGKDSSCERKKRPLVAMIHGGPHSSFSTWFTQDPIFYLSAGFNVVMINYTGSSCYGEESCTALLGKVGTLDVMDCEDAIRATLRTHPENDPANVFLTGGSHGGFLTSHLICRLDRGITYRAASIRNPVWNLAVSYYTSDIPDWAITEAGGEELPSDEEKLMCLYRHSPAAHVANAKVPTAIFLGRDDRRCPNEQGLSLHRALRALGVPSEVWVYPEGHPFNKPLHKGDSFVNTALWFYKFYKHN